MPAGVTYASRAPGPDGAAELAAAITLAAAGLVVAGLGGETVAAVELEDDTPDAAAASLGLSLARLLAGEHAATLTAANPINVSAPMLRGATEPSRIRNPCQLLV